MARERAPVNYREPAIYDISSDNATATPARAGSAKSGSVQSADEAAAEDYDWGRDRRIVEVWLRNLAALCLLRQHSRIAQVIGACRGAHVAVHLVHSFSSINGFFWCHARPERGDEVCQALDGEQPGAVGAADRALPAAAGRRQEGRAPVRGCCSS